MRCIVLAAGRGTRLGDETTDLPKCLVDLGDGTSFLSRLIAVMLDEVGLAGLVAVTGHRTERVEALVAGHRHAERLATAFNPDYASSGPIVSIAVVRDRLLAEDFVLCNGDTAYAASLVRRLLAVDAPLALAVERKAEPAPDEVMVRVDPRTSHLLEVGKRLASADVHGVSTGMLAVRGAEARAAFVEMVMRYADGSDASLRQRVWHDLLNGLTADGVPVSAVTVEPGTWREVDTVEELRASREELGG
ncbi:MAG: hypothetical protein EA398_16650 [Deltaproteobacteria bacterium]|nr:MAG: hypothetical protein EA398_16650 [Deltaproteobacteria bacterium]